MSRLSVSPEKRQTDADLLPTIESASAAPPPPSDSSSCWSDFVTSTPYRPSSQALRIGLPLADERNILKEELGPYTVATVEHIHGLFADLLADEAIDTFLKECGLYDLNSAEWHMLAAMAGKAEKFLYPELLKIFEAILEKFVDPTGMERKALNTHNKRLQGVEIRQTSPDFVVHGSGPSFQCGEGDPTGTRYSNILTFFDGKRDSKMNNLSEHLGQANVYIRCVHPPITADCLTDKTVSRSQSNNGTPTQPRVCSLPGRFSDACAGHPLRPSWARDIALNKRPLPSPDLCSPHRRPHEQARASHWIRRLCAVDHRRRRAEEIRDRGSDRSR